MSRYTAADHGFKRAQPPLHPAKLLGARKPADLLRNPRCFAVIALEQYQAVVLGQLHQMLARFLQQARIGWMRHRLEHHRHVHDQPISAGSLEHTELAHRLDRGHQQRLRTFLAEALSLARQTRPDNGRLDLQTGLADEELPLRILDPGVDGDLIGTVIRMLQIKQLGHQPWRQRRPACRTCKVRQKPLNLRPVHRNAQQHQLVLGVEALRQGKAK